jgi:hypothetical protein
MPKPEEQGGMPQPRHFCPPKHHEGSNPMESSRKALQEFAPHIPPKKRRRIKGTHFRLLLIIREQSLPYHLIFIRRQDKNAPLASMGIIHCRIPHTSAITEFPPGLYNEMSNRFLYCHRVIIHQVSSTVQSLWLYPDTSDVINIQPNYRQQD